MAIKVLFVFGQWRICSGYGQGSMQIFVSHEGYHKEGYYATRTETKNCWGLRDSQPQCILCKEAVPDEIQALVQLYDAGRERQ